VYRLQLIDEKTGKTVVQWSRLTGPVVRSVVDAIGALVPALQGLAAVKQGLQSAGLLPAARPKRGGDAWE
jgi:hypothetical protein